MATIDPKTREPVLTFLEQLQLLGAYYKEHNDPVTLMDSETNTVIGRVDPANAVEVAKNHLIHKLWKIHRTHALVQIKHLGNYEVLFLARRPVRIMVEDVVQEIHPRAFKFLRDHGRVICEGVVLEALDQ